MFELPDTYSIYFLCSTMSVNVLSAEQRGEKKINTVRSAAGGRLPALHLDCDMH